MRVIRNASAGTMESSDAMVLAWPGSQGIQIELHSTVYDQFGRQMEQVARSVAEELGVENVNLQIRDFGALDCTLRARVKTALNRAAEEG